MSKEKGAGFLSHEAKRLMEFKKQNIRKNDLTPCPQCATLVKIQAVKCPQCTSDISDHTSRVREELGNLEKVTAELSELHKKEQELFQKEAGEKPFWERIRGFCGDPHFLQDMKIVLPFLILLFGLILFLKNQASGLVFLGGSLGACFVVYFLFEKWSLKKFVTLDLYRTVLLGGLLVILSSATLDSANFWPEFSLLENDVVRVVSTSANIRETPSTSSGIVTTVHSGERLSVLESQGSWFRVRTKDGDTGWVFSNLVD